jgi:hypothetical protein
MAKRPPIESFEYLRPMRIKRLAFSLSQPINRTLFRHENDAYAKNINKIYMTPDFCCKAVYVRMKYSIKR